MDQDGSPVARSGAGHASGAARSRRVNRGGTIAPAASGRFNRGVKFSRLRSPTRDGPSRRSIGSSWRSWKRRESARAAAARSGRSCAEPRSISSACRPRPRKSDAFLADDESARFRAACRSAAGVAALRRTLGAALARPRPLCGQQRNGRQPRLLRRLAVSRLRDRRRSTPTSL